MIGPTQIAIILVLILVLFFLRPGKLSSLMGEMAKGITAFRKGIKDEDENDTTITDKTIDDDEPKQ